MDWRDEAIVLAARPYGESSAVVQLLTRAHGRHAGLVRGGASRRGRHTVEPGTMVVATWRARLADHLGHLTLDPSRQQKPNAKVARSQYMAQMVLWVGMTKLPQTGRLL